MILGDIYKRLESASTPARTDDASRALEPLIAKLEPSLSSDILAGLGSLPGKMREASSVLRSPDAEEKAVIPLAPLTACRSVNPEFRWTTAADTPFVEVKLFRRDEMLFAFLSESDCFPYPGNKPSLARGATYHYFLDTPDSPGKPARRAGPFFFHVLAEESAASLEDSLESLHRAGIEGPARQFFSALILSAAGLDGESLPLVESLVKDNEGGAAALMLLGSIQAAAGDEAGLDATLKRLKEGNGSP